MRISPLVLSCLALGATLRAQAPLDPRTMLANLQQLKAQHQQTTRQTQNQTIHDFSSAAASAQAAVAFYQQAVQVTQFVGTDRQQTEMHDWKKKQADLLHSPDFGLALQTCLTYMTLSMQRAAGLSETQLIPALLTYAQQTDAQMPTIYDQQVVGQPISQNIFARWYGVGDQLGGLENWEQVPVNTDGIYTKLILPWMRKNHDRRIVPYWDNKIAAVSKRAAGARGFNADVFATTTKPELLWSRAEDMLAIGMRDPATAEMYAIIRTYPTHPSAEKWIDELQVFLTNPAAIPAAIPAGAAGPAAPTVAQ